MKQYVILESEEDFKNHKKFYFRLYSAPLISVKHINEPEDYPCVVKTYPTIELKDVGSKCILEYKFKYITNRDIFLVEELTKGG